MDRQTFTNSIGVWEIQEDGSIRLISEAEVPIERKVRKNAGGEKRHRIR